MSWFCVFATAIRPAEVDDPVLDALQLKGTYPGILRAVLDREKSFQIE